MLSQEKWFNSCIIQKNSSYSLIFFPYAGGTAKVFEYYKDKLPNDVNFYAVQYPGRGQRIHEDALDDISDIAKKILPCLLTIPHKWIFLGYSLGALVAFELCCFLKKTHNITPACLIVCAMRAPNYRTGETQSYYDIPRDKFKDMLFNLGGTPESILNDNELLNFLLPTLRADFEACRKYSPQNQVIGCPIFLLTGKDDTLISKEALSTWKFHTDNKFYNIKLKGGHFFIYTAKEKLLNKILNIIKILKNK